MYTHISISQRVKDNEEFKRMEKEVKYCVEGDHKFWLHVKYPIFVFFIKEEQN